VDGKTVENFNSAIYTGWVGHRRFLPKKHQLRYNVFMMLLDLDELDEIFNKSWLWSTKKWGLAQFKREDFFGDKSIPLDIAVRKRVEEEAGFYPQGPIRLLTNLRYFGFIMNPISCYYCFDKNEKLQAILAEVNNTPWNERHGYVLVCDPDKDQQQITFDKKLHVSPFNPMDIEYHWKSNLPAKNLRIYMQNYRKGNIEFDASVVLERQEITVSRLRWLIVKYPFMTLKVMAAIYWQAMLLLLKKVPVYSHKKTI
jgi:DUF1365 family protein